MSREVKMNLRRTRDGTFVGISLYDDSGRWVLTSRADTLDTLTAEHIDEFLRTGRLTFFATRAIKQRVA